MVIDLLYVPGCPNLDLARGRLRTSLDIAGLTATINEAEVATPKAAALAGLRGSPTILIDRRDPFMQPNELTSLSCRLFDVGGQIEGAPSVDQLVAALQEARP